MPGSFISDDFLLESDVAADLYFRFARDLPIIDFHTHLSPEWMAENHRFRSITEIWLDGDHYKWRAMRAIGTAERLCSGDAPDWDRFEAWARAVPETLLNPLYHWTHMELRRPFGIDLLLGPATAKTIFERCNERLQEDAFRAMGLLESFRVAAVCSTDDPADSLNHHAVLAERTHPVTRVYPTWRPDRALEVGDPTAWNAWVRQLEAAANMSIVSLKTFLEALDKRHAYFQLHGCRASDHGLETIPAEAWSDGDVAISFDALRAGRTLDAGPALRLQSALLHRLAVMDHQRGFVQQFHLGALRNVSARLMSSIGPNVGADTIGDFELVRPLARFLDALDRTGTLTRTILYNLNPRDNEAMATLAGSFQDGSTPGKMQYGAAWWFLDQRDGIEAQLRALSNMGLLSQFVGMVTDSRSFLSYSRHDYFRRLLCNLLGDSARRGLVPHDTELLGGLVTRVAFTNARDYFGFTLGSAAGPGA